MNTDNRHYSSEFSQSINYVFENIFPSWINHLGLQVEYIENGYAELSIQYNEDIFRKTGSYPSKRILCGQAIMAIADTSLVFSVIGSLGKYIDMTTVDLTTQFLRPVIDDKIKIQAYVLQLGKKLVRGKVDIVDTNKRVCASSLVCYAFV